MNFISSYKMKRSLFKINNLNEILIKFFFFIIFKDSFFIFFFFKFFLEALTLDVDVALAIVAIVGIVAIVAIVAIVEVVAIVAVVTESEASKMMELSIFF